LDHVDFGGELRDGLWRRRNPTKSVRRQGRIVGIDEDTLVESLIADRVTYRTMRRDCNLPPKAIDGYGRDNFGHS